MTPPFEQGKKVEYFSPRAEELYRSSQVCESAAFISSQAPQVKSTSLLLMLQVES